MNKDETKNDIYNSKESQWNVSIALGECFEISGKEYLLINFGSDYGNNFDYYVLYDVKISQMEKLVVAPLGSTSIFESKFKIHTRNFAIILDLSNIFK